MHDEEKTKNVVCSAFEKHRFKDNLCAHCFKPKALHKDLSIPVISNDIPNVKIINLQDDVNMSQESATKPTHRKYESPRVVPRNRNNLQKGDRSRTERQTDRNDKKKFRERQREHGPSSQTRDTRDGGGKAKGMTLNIPPESDLPSVSDEKGSGRSGLSHSGMYNNDSCSENGSIAGNLPMEMPEKEQNGNYYLSTSFDSDRDSDLSGSYSNQFRKALKPVQRSGSPQKGVDKSGGERDQPEFLKVAKNLRHIQPILSPPMEIHSSNNNHSVVEVEDSLADLSDLPDLPDVIDNDASVVDQQKLIDSKSKLPPPIAHIVMNSQSSVTGHETLPKNIGKSRPSIKPLTKHQRQSSDPELFVPSEKEEIVANVNEETSVSGNKINTENVTVMNSQVNSEIYFGKSPVQSPQRAKKEEEHRDLMTRYAHVADCVTIISASGEVSHYRNSENSGATSSGHTETPDKNAKHKSQTNRTNAYKVVDISKTKPHKTKNVEGKSPAVKGKELPPANSRASQEMDEGVGLAQHDEAAVRSQEHSMRFPRRNVVLVDGVYSINTTQFATDSGINESMESSDSSEGQKIEASTETPSKRNTPPYPILLHEEQPPDRRKQKRNSGQYKVPIFIMPQGYDNTSPKANKSATEIISMVPENGDPSIEYLQPNEKSDIQSDNHPNQKAKEEQLEETQTGGMMESKKVSVSSESLLDSRRPSRNRSKTHPIMVDAPSSSTKKDHDKHDHSRTRQKRTAPRPPSLEISEQGFSRERDVRLDSLPYRSPPPPPLTKKESKQMVDRNSSDLSDEIDRVFQPRVSDDDKSKVESHVTPSSAKCDRPKREMSPVRRKDSSPTRHRDMSPARHRHELRNGVSVKRDLVNGTRPRELSPVGRDRHRELSPVGRENRPNTPSSKRVASPPPPFNRPQALNLPDATATGSAPAFSKSKKSKLPWKRRKKRDEPGSPEREFNSEEVEKWLINSFPASPDLVQPATRNSLERLEVINAYKGEPTAVIIRPKNNADTAANRNSFQEEDEAEPGKGGNSASKRRAPLPPVPTRAADFEVEETDSNEETLHLQKSYSLSPTSRRKNATSKEEGPEEEHLYENLGPNRAKMAPAKPVRRRQRNRTTGFEDMPSRVKRMAPKTPESQSKQENKPEGSEEPKEPVDDSTETSAKKQLLPVFNDVAISSSPPLKSALRTTISESSKKQDIESKENVAPKRPVRIIAPEDLVSKPELSQPTVLRSNYKNLALVPIPWTESNQSNDAGGGKESVSRTREGLVVDIGTQCTLQSLENSTLDQPSQNDLLSDINHMHLHTLTQLGRPPAEGCQDWSGVNDMQWGQLLSLPQEPSCCSAGAAFYDVKHPNDSSRPSGLMVCCNPNKASQVLNMAEITKAMTSQANLISVHHATKDTVTIDPSLTELRKSRGSPQTSGSIETALVVTDFVPSVNVSNYVTHNLEKHEYLPEIYERDVALMLLQLCQGLCQLQSHRMCLESLKLDHLLLANSRLPGGGQQLVINHLMGAEIVTPTDSAEIASKLEQKCHEFDVGILVYEFLHQPNPFSMRTSLIISDYTSNDLPAIPVKSPLSNGLHTIACKLLSKKPEERLTCSQAVSLFQCLLWGPSANVYLDNATTPEALNHVLERWLISEQAKLVTKAALFSILGSTSRDATGFALSDQLHCQYLADLTVERCREAMELLYGKLQRQTVSVIDTDIDL